MRDNLFVPFREVTAIYRTSIVRCTTAPHRTLHNLARGPCMTRGFRGGERQGKWKGKSEACWYLAGKRSRPTMRPHHRCHNRSPPSYHWEGFGRKSTKPPWFDCRVFDKERRDFGWVIKDFGSPKTINRPVRKGAALFVHDADTRLYRPTVPQQGSLSVEVPATPSSRMLVVGEDEALGCKGREKLAIMQDAFRRSHLQMLANLNVSRRSELRETIYGRGETIKKPLLYPQNMTHQQALNLEKKAGPSLPFDSKPARSSREGLPPKPFETWNQHMYLPYSRTRADFSHLTTRLS